MKLGIIARSDTSGLGHQSTEAADHLNPHKVAVVEPAQRGKANPRDVLSGWPRFRWERDWSVPGLFEWLADCDVVWTAETFYDPNLSRRLDGVGVATVLHANPELYDRTHGSHWASTVWTPTGWWADNVPGSVVMPHPTPVHHYPQVLPLESPLRIVHPSAYAMADRNGTRLVKRCAHTWQSLGWTVDVTGPEGRMVDEFWQRDPGAAVSVIPRRYGGQCLSALEALSAGVPVVMPDISPNREWPIIGVRAKHTGSLLTKGGRCIVYDISPADLTQTVVALLNDAGWLAEERVKARAWAEDHSWEMLGPRWLEGFAQVLDHR